MEVSALNRRHERALELAAFSALQEKQQHDDALHNATNRQVLRDQAKQRAMLSTNTENGVLGIDNARKIRQLSSPLPSRGGTVAVVTPEQENSAPVTFPTATSPLGKLVEADAHTVDKEKYLQQSRKAREILMRSMNRVV